MAQSILARLGVVMTVNSAEFKKGLDDATRESRAFQAELKRQNNESKKFAAEVGGAFTKIAGVVAVAGAAIYKAFSYADQIKDTADALDITVGSLMRMQMAFEGAGGEADKMGSLLNKLTVNQDKAKEGADNVREAFTRLGIAGGEVEKLAPDKLFERVAYELSKIDEPAKRNALAFEILGKAARGTNWKAYWEDYSKGENASKNVSEALEAGAQAWDNLKRAGTMALNAILVLAKPLADLINGFAEAVGRNKEAGRTDTYTGAFNEAKKELESNPDYLRAGLKVRREMIDARAKELQLAKEVAKVEGSGTSQASGTGAGYSKASTKDQGAMRERAALAEAFKIRVEQLSTVGKQIQRETELIGLNEQEAERQKMRWALEDENLKMQLDLQKQIELEKAKGADADQLKINMLKEQMQLYGVMIDMTKTVAEADLRAKEQKIRQQQILTNTEKQGFDSMVNNFQVLGQQSKKAFDAWKAFSIIQTIIDTYSGAQKAFTSMAGIPFIGPALGVAAAAAAIGAGMARVNMIRSQQYQGRQRGGSIVANTPYMVGEAGPELVIPHKGGTVIPNNQLSSVMGGGGISYNGPYIANLQAIDTQSAMEFISKNKQAIWSANLSAQRSVPSLR